MFDVVVGNPPYNGKIGKNKTHSLWRKFIKKSPEFGSTVLFVTPDTFLGNQKALKMFSNGSLSYVRMLGSNRFSGASISTAFWLWEATNKKDKDKTLLELETGEFVSFDISKGDLPTSSITGKIVYNIQAKMINVCNASGVVPTHSSKIYYAHKIKSDKNCWPIYNTTAQGRCWSDRKPDDLERRKIMFSNCGAYKVVFDDGQMGSCWHSHSIFVNDEETTPMLNYLETKIIKYYNKINRLGGFINETFSHNIPKIDLSRSWTDQQLYEHFGLTQEEIEEIENSINTIDFSQHV